MLHGSCVQIATRANLLAVARCCSRNKRNIGTYIWRIAHTLGMCVRRPFTPWNECSVCWSNDDKKHLLRCTHCNDAYHIYCLEPPLEEVRSRLAKGHVLFSVGAVLEAPCTHEISIIIIATRALSICRVQDFWPTLGIEPCLIIRAQLHAVTDPRLRTGEGAEMVLSAVRGAARRAAGGC